MSPWNTCSLLFPRSATHTCTAKRKEITGRDRNENRGGRRSRSFIPVRSRSQYLEDPKTPSAARKLKCRKVKTPRGRTASGHPHAPAARSNRESLRARTGTHGPGVPAPVTRGRRGQQPSCWGRRWGARCALTPQCAYSSPCRFPRSVHRAQSSHGRPGGWELSNREEGSRLTAGVI